MIRFHYLAVIMLAASLAALASTGCGLPYLEESACGSLGPAECDVRSDCSFVWAAPLEGASCLGRMEPLGCTETFSECRGNLSAEADGSGNCWLFRDSCRPDGWRSVDASVATCPLEKLASAPSCSTEAVDCSSLQGDDCLAETACRPVFARHYDNIDECVGPTVQIACAARDDRCASSTSVLRHGECWMFANECVPDSWHPTYGGGLSGCGIAQIWEKPACANPD